MLIVKKEKLSLALIDDFMDTNSIIWQLLFARYLPFVIEKENPSIEHLCITNATFLEGIAKAIRNYANLPLNEYYNYVPNSAIEKNKHNLEEKNENKETANQELEDNSIFDSINSMC